MSRRVASFDVTAELLLDLLRPGTDDIPPGAKLLKVVELDRTYGLGITDSHFNKLRFFIEDDSFPEVHEGAIPITLRPIYRP